MAASGLYLSRGIRLWHQPVQPKQDELLSLQIEKLKWEILMIEKQFEKKNSL
jgi:hypothetical protein